MLIMLAATDPSPARIADFVVLFILIACLTIGLISMLIGKIIAIYDVLHTHFYVNNDRAEPPAELVRIASGTPGTYQANAGTDTSSNDEIEPPQLDRRLRRLDDTELIALLAVQRRSDNSFRFSANEVAQLIGGTRKHVLDQVRAIRGGPPPVEQPRPDPRYRDLDAASRPVLKEP